MSTLFNSAAYGVVSKELSFFNYIFIASLWHSLVFKSLASINCSIYARSSIKKVPATQFFILFDVLNFNRTAIDL